MVLLLWYETMIYLYHSEDLGGNMDKEKIFEFIYLMAFRDATMRKAFPKRNDESEENFKRRKEKAFSEAKGIARDYIDKLVAGVGIKPEM